MFAIIAENDESQWADDTGVLYHFPKRYTKFLTPGTKVIYYKGRIKKLEYRNQRLDDAPHYFATAEIGNVYADKNSSKGDLFATIEKFNPFKKAILAKNNNQYLEVIPENKKSNYWRDGVRAIDKSTFDKISSMGIGNSIQESFSQPSRFNENEDINFSFESLVEGSSTQKLVTIYERNPKYRKQAIAIHGTSCFACGFNFEDFYGEYGKGFIHIHHVKPVSSFDKPQVIDPEKDLIPLCANCHAMVHKNKLKTLTLSELKTIIINKN